MREGFTTPQPLLDTMIFYNGIIFALQSGDEHWQLRFNSSQIEYVEKSEERPYLNKTLVRARDPRANGAWLSKLAN